MRRAPAWTDAELSERRPVWEALSSLFLDTDVTLLREWRASALAASSFTVDQLEEILTDEVFPLCRWNLHQVAGEWTGFDLEWLERHIQLQRQSRFRFLGRLDFRGRSATRDPEWQATRAAVLALRARREAGHDLPAQR